MMYALDNFGRKITSISAFIGAGIMAIVFANAGSEAQLLIFGFIMVFFIQVAGNSMQIFASEVFPTNARASGFGWAAGVGRLSTAGIFIDHPVAAEGLWSQRGVRVDRRLADHRRVLRDVAWPGGETEGPRRNRPADRLVRAAQS